TPVVAVPVPMFSAARPTPAALRRVRVPAVGELNITWPSSRPPVPMFKELTLNAFVPAPNFRVLTWAPLLFCELSPTLRTLAVIVVGAGRTRVETGPVTLVPLVGLTRTTPVAGSRLIERLPSPLRSTVVVVPAPAPAVTPPTTNDPLVAGLLTTRL